MGLEHLSAYVVVLVVSGVADIAAALSVWRWRGRVGRASLCAVLLAAAVWCVAYALELVASGDSRVLWGALKFIGTTLLPPAWLIFALQYTGRLTRPRRRLLAALAIEPALVLLLLAYSPTRSLIRSYPAEQLQATLPTVRLGVAYWVHFVYTNALVLAASAILLLTLMRISRLYWRQSIVLGVAICLPLIANVMSSLDVAPFAQFNATPIARLSVGMDAGPRSASLPAARSASRRPDTGRRDDARRRRRGRRARARGRRQPRGAATARHPRRGADRMPGRHTVCRPRDTGRTRSDATPRTDCERPGTAPETWNSS